MKIVVLRMVSIICFYGISLSFLCPAVACPKISKQRCSGIKKAMENLSTEKVLQLKVGALVMLLVNKRLPNKCRNTDQSKPFSLPNLNLHDMMVLPNGYRDTPLVNGSVGVVVGFKKWAVDGVDYPVVEFAQKKREHITPCTQSGELGHLGKYAAFSLHEYRVLECF